MNTELYVSPLKIVLNPSAIFRFASSELDCCDTVHPSREELRLLALNEPWPELAFHSAAVIAVTLGVFAAALESKFSLTTPPIGDKRIPVRTATKALEIRPASVMLFWVELNMAPTQCNGSEPIV
jgi:sugar/nucleoside kinase (ribokinase family)